MHYYFGWLISCWFSKIVSTDEQHLRSFGNYAAIQLAYQQAGILVWLHLKSWWIEMEVYLKNHVLHRRVENGSSKFKI